MNNGTFIMIDGIDGSGKSTIMTTWKEVLEAAGKSVFVLKDFWAQHNRHPEPKEIPEDTFAIISAEPTNIWIGAAIRQEMIQKHDREYSAHAIASAFAMDRLVLYKRVHMPARVRGIHIIQDRGVSTSLCYQALTLQDQGITREHIAELEGNAFALQNAPDILLLLDVAPETCVARLAGRVEKDDNAIFEQIAFQKQADACFRSPEFQEFFTKNGSKVHTFNADQELDILQPQLRDLLSEYLATKL